MRISKESLIKCLGNRLKVAQGLRKMFLDKKDSVCAGCQTQAIETVRNIAIQFGIFREVERWDIKTQSKEKEVAKILRNIADKYEHDGELSGPIMDSNGNTIGHWTIEK